VVLYGCETLSLTLREEHRVRVFENRVLWRIFGPRRYEVTGGCRKLHNEELRNAYSSPSVIRMIKPRRMMGRACSTNGGKSGMRVGYWWESQKESGHYDDIDVGEWIILKWILERLEGVGWTGLIWPMIGTSGGFYRTW
jgi:hypothetical protein